jgi:hypothetical protein
MAADVPRSEVVRASPADEMAAHEDSYRGFIEFVYVAGPHIANFLVALAIGGVEGYWGVALFIMVVTTALSAYCLMTRAKAPLAALTGFSLLALVAAG